LNRQKYNRRNFFKLTGYAVVISSVALWDKLIGREKQLTTKHQVSFPFNPNRKIAFAGNFIIINSENQTKVLSARCTHLGCMINHVEKDSLVCPCHGSVFDENGNPVKGPAIKPLVQYSFSIKSKTSQIIIHE